MFNKRNNEEKRQICKGQSIESSCTIKNDPFAPINDYCYRPKLGVLWKVDLRPVTDTQPLSPPHLALSPCGTVFCFLEKKTKFETLVKNKVTNFL